jgi:hypothetical protein
MLPTTRGCMRCMYPVEYTGNQRRSLSRRAKPYSADGWFERTRTPAGQHRRSTRTVFGDGEAHHIPQIGVFDAWDERLCRPTSTYTPSSVDTRRPAS